MASSTNLSWLFVIFIHLKYGQLGRFQPKTNYQLALCFQHSSSKWYPTLLKATKRISTKHCQTQTRKISWCFWIDDINFVLFAEEKNETSRNDFWVTFQEISQLQLHPNHSFLSPSDKPQHSFLENQRILKREINGLFEPYVKLAVVFGGSSHGS